LKSDFHAGSSKGPNFFKCDVCKGLSLNDSYWDVSRGFGGRFAQFNLYENPFSEILPLVA
jgi:hypothetical protein